jgi:hypothetical protein
MADTGISFACFEYSPLIIFFTAGPMEDGVMESISAENSSLSKGRYLSVSKTIIQNGKKASSTKNAVCAA